MYRFRGLNVHHFEYFEPQKFKSGPGVLELPGAVSELLSGLALCRDNLTNTDGVWELRMRPQLREKG